MKKILIATAILVSLAIGVFTAAKAQSGWEVIETGFESYILYDMSFPEGQSTIGYAVGSTSTYNGDGVIIKTEDGGETWEQISEGIIPGLEAVFFTDLNTGYAGGWDDYIFKTEDGGETWTEITVNSNIWYIIDMEFWDENNGVVAGWGGLVYVTEDAGETWTAGTGASGIQDLCYASEEVLIAVGGDENIHKSVDGGLTWTEIYSGIFQYMFLGVEFLNEDFGVVGGEDGKILMTQDGGTTWTENNSSFYHLWHAFHIFNEDSIYVAGTPEGIWKTTDGGSTWVDDYPESTYNPALYKIIFTADNNTGYVCGSQGTFMRKIGPAPAPAALVAPETISFPQTLVGETYDTTITITNTGNALLSVSNIVSDNPVFSVETTTLEIAPGAYEEVTVSFAPDAVELFTGILNISSNDPVNPEIEVDLDGEGIEELFPAGSVSTEEILYPITWVGETFDYTVTIANDGGAPLLVSNIVSDNGVFSSNVATLEVAAGDYEEITVTFAPDATAYFEGTLTIECNDPVNPVFEISLQGEGLMPMAVLSVSDAVVFDTTTVNNTSIEMVGVSNIGNITLEVSSVNISGGAFDVDLSSFSLEPGETQNLTVSFTPDAQGLFEESMEIESNDASSPAVVSLSGYGQLGTGIFYQSNQAEDLKAYPNPFNSRVEIRFKSAQTASLTIRIYNMFGGLVKEIEQENAGSATHEYVWQGTDQAGEQVPSGIYFGVVEDGKTKNSIKLIKR